MKRTKWGGRRAQRLTALTLATYGTRCHLAIPGVCTGTATVADHVTPRSRGGADALHNLRPACQPCNLAKSDTLPHESTDLTFFKADRRSPEGLRPVSFPDPDQNPATVLPAVAVEKTPSRKGLPL